MYGRGLESVVEADRTEKSRSGDEGGREQIKTKFKTLRERYDKESNRESERYRNTERKLERER